MLESEKRLIPSFLTPNGKGESVGPPVVETILFPRMDLDGTEDVEVDLRRDGNYPTPNPL